MAWVVFRQSADHLSLVKLNSKMEATNSQVKPNNNKRYFFQNYCWSKVALVGKMGSGSRSIKVDCGILEPTAGAILIDGVDVRQIDQADIRKNVGVMLQESWLFSGTIRENIQMGFNEYDDNHILNICKVSGVDDFVGANPKGYDLEIRERGIGLSGKKQTINLARSLIHNPKFYFWMNPLAQWIKVLKSK